jgi:hypothetical protein
LPDFSELAREKLSGEFEYQRLAEIEFLLVRDREIFFLVVGIVGHVSMSSSTSVSQKNFPVFRHRTASCSCGCPRLANSNECSSSFQSTDTGIGGLPFAAAGGATPAVIATRWLAKMGWTAPDGIDVPE